MLPQKTQAVLKRYGAVPVERDGWNICCALGLSASTEKAPGASLRPVQCALQLLSCVAEASLSAEPPAMLSQHASAVLLAGIAADHRDPIHGDQELY